MVGPSVVTACAPLISSLGRVVTSGDSQEFHGPTIEEFLPAPIAFEGTLFEFNRLNVVQWISVAFIVIVFVLYAKRAKLVPGRAQVIIEALLDFVRTNIAQEVIGKTAGLRYTPLLTVIFISILFLNLTGIIPGLNIAGTAQIAMPLVLALVTYVVFIGSGIKAQGAGKYFKDALFPPGVPWPIYIVLTPIEALSTFVIRPFTLIIRLLANMVSGHMLLALTFLATQYFIVVQGSVLFKVLGVGTFALALVLILFEIFIACLQAYIFTILSAAYINMSIHEAH
ncbi:MAG: F0F1 ATP synthase subunit A [Actinomycetaceae bacterium]|nr:F0F1 ATP synthase subunit A [Actinomycetaceae bacterium]